MTALHCGLRPEHLHSKPTFSKLARLAFSLCSLAFACAGNVLAQPNLPPIPPMVMAQAAKPVAAAKPQPAYEQAYQQSLAIEQKKYADAIKQCAAELAPAQCKRRAKLEKERAAHDAKLVRASAKASANQAKTEESQRMNRAPKPASKKPQAASAKKPLTSQAPPPKIKHSGGALSKQPNTQAQREHAAKQANLEQNVAKLQAKNNQKAAQREAKNQKRREAGYTVDAKPAP